MPCPYYVNRCWVTPPLVLRAAKTLYNIGQCHSELGELDEAMRCYNEFVCIIHCHQQQSAHHSHFFRLALDTLCDTLGAFHPEVAYTLQQIGNVVYGAMQDSAAAAEFYQRSKKVVQNIMHDNLVVPLDNFAQLFRSRGQYEESLGAYRTIHAIQVEAYGEESLTVASTLSNIGLMHFKLRQFDAAYAAYKEALRIRCALHENPDHPDISFTLNALGLVYYFSKNVLNWPIAVSENVSNFASRC